MSESFLFASVLPRVEGAAPVKRWRALLPAGLLLLAVLLLYLPFAGNPLVFDDGMTLNAVQVQTYRDWHTLLDIRGLPHVTFYWTDVAGPHHLFWWRLGNVLLHALNACLLMAFARRLCAAALPQGHRAPAHLAWPAFWVALLFAVHPVAVFGVGYLAQRTILMATTFSLLAWLAWLKGTQEGRARPFYTACACYLLAVMCKEHAIMAAPVAFLLTALSPLPRRALLKKAAVPLLLFALTGLYVFYTVKTGSQIIGHAYQYEGQALLAREAQAHAGFDPRQAYWLSVITQAGLFFKYLWLWLLPVPGWLSVDLYTPFAPRLLSFFLFGLAGYLAYGAIAIWLLLQRGSRGVLGFALLAPWLLFMTELSTVRIQDPFVLYRSYLWLPGLLAALPLALCRLPRTWLGVGIVASFLALAPMTFVRLQTFSDPVLLWDDAARVAGGPPYHLGMERIYTNRGNGWAQMGALARAIADYRLAVRINPQAPQPHYGLAGMYLAAGRNAEALREYDQAARLAPGVPMIYYFRGLAQVRLHQAVAAARDFSRVIAARPHDARAWLQRGIAEAQLQQYPAALRDLYRAQALGSGLKQVFWEKGQVYQAMQAPGLARANYQRACTAGYKPACTKLPAAGGG